MTAMEWFVFGGGVCVGIVVGLAGVAVGIFLDRAGRLGDRGGPR